MTRFSGERGKSSLLLCDSVYLCRHFGSSKRACRGRESGNERDASSVKRQMDELVNW